MKKKVVSMLLALVLVVTGVPSGVATDTVYAAEVSESRTVFSDVAEETNSVLEQNDASEESMHFESGDLYAFNVAENGRAVGSDGVVYEDVVYLSAENVKALGVEGQNVYVEICDQIAKDKKAGNYLESAAIAVDAEGNLFVQREVSFNILWDSIENLAKDFSEEIAASQQDSAEENNMQPVGKKEEFTIEESVEENAVFEDQSEEVDLKNEDSDNQNVVEETETAEETAEVETSVNETAFAEESSTEASEEYFIEENSDQETSIDESAVMEESLTEEEIETVTNEFVLTAENMDLVDGYDTEEFEIIENAKADVLIDLGYGNTGDVAQFNSILPQNDWFSKQLTKSQSSIYNACKVMGKGTNTFTIKSSTLPEIPDIFQAISAYIMTEPYKCDWMDLTQNPKIIDHYLVDTITGKKTYNKKTDVELAKSPYWNADIQKAANDKVLKIASQAQNYALEKYPDFPVFGIVEYFDKWICENNYYNDIGTIASDKLKDNEKDIYYYCHSSYGILLKGYGVCESYALAMTRLLDAIGIPNMYATGQALDENGNSVGGHAWNYIQMPNGNWYLQDSTWNDGGDTSLQYWLLTGDDKLHFPVGNRFIIGTKPFEFVIPASSSYQPVSEIVLSKKEINLIPKQKEKLECTNAYTSEKNVPKSWISSNEKVAKVDSEGNVTAVAPGSAEIKYVVAGITATCTVNVHQINSIAFVDGGKTSLAASSGAKDGKWEPQVIEMTVSHKDNTCEYSAEKLVNDKIFSEPAVVSAKDTVATAEYVLEGDTLKLIVTPKAKGSTKITVAFEGKKATLNFSVMGEQLDESMFDLQEVEALGTKSNPFTGKAYKPKIVLSAAGKEKKVKFKVNYLNNKDAGTASVVIVGSGDYGGQIVRTFKIDKMPLNVVDPEKIKIKDSAFNGGVNQMKSAVKNLNQYTDEKGKKIQKKTGLKAGVDYDILYTNTKTKEETITPVEVGTYTMQIVGKNNYEGTFSLKGEYKITPIDIKKAKVAVKVNGTTPTIIVSIGKNELELNKDYKLTYYTDKKCEEETNGSVFLSKTQYFVKVEAVGTNLTNQKPIVKSFKTK